MSEGKRDDSPPKAEPVEKNEDVEKKEEEKLKAKYPMAAQGPHGGHNALLQKRLARGQKFFDSGDYNMAKQGAGKQLFGNRPRNAPSASGPTVPNPMMAPPTGAAIPTPETVPARKTSIIQQPKFPSSSSVAGPPTVS